MFILITGRPGIGKTTVLEKLAQKLSHRAYGFITKEIRQGRKRVGFDIFSPENEFLGRLARRDFKSNYRVGAYGVDLESFEKAVLPLLKPVSNKILIIDEIGKMELFSVAFREKLLKLKDPNCIVISSIMQKTHPFADRIKNLEKSIICEVTLKNRDNLVNELYLICAK